MPVPLYYHRLSPRRSNFELEQSCSSLPGISSDKIKETTDPSVGKAIYNFHSSGNDATRIFINNVTSEFEITWISPAWPLIPDVAMKRLRTLGFEPMKFFSALEKESASEAPKGTRRGVRSKTDKVLPELENLVKNYDGLGLEGADDENVEIGGEESRLKGTEGGERVILGLRDTAAAITGLLRKCAKTVKEIESTELDAPYPGARRQLFYE